MNINLPNRHTIACLTLASCLFGSGAAAEEPVFYFEDRADIPEQYTWDLSLQFATPAAWDEAVTRLEERLGDIELFKGKVALSPTTMADALAAQFDLYGDLGPIYTYALKGQHLVGHDQDARQRASRATGLLSELNQTVSFVDAEIAMVPAEEAAKFSAHEALKPYAQYLDNIWRKREHTRSPEIEEVVAGSGQSGQGHVTAYESLLYADMTWPTIEDENGESATLNPGQFGRLMRSPDRSLRAKAFTTHMQVYEDYRNTLAATMAAKIQRDVWLARVYNYPSAVDAALDAVPVPREVMTALIGAVHNNLDKVAGYADLRRRLLGLEDFHPWDRHATALQEGERVYTFEEGWELAMEFWTETYGAEYAAIAQQALDERWVDVYSNEGKTNGAYSWGTYRAPYYLLLNWAGSLSDVSTLVHEMGHSVHGVLADRHQLAHEADTDLFIAEVASVASESLFGEWLFARSTDKQERIQLLDLALTNIRDTFVRQVFFHEWEAAVHKMAEDGQALTADSMGKAYMDLSEKYYGEVLTHHPLQRNYWARIAHYFRNFYVWKYATSYAAGEALATRFRSGDKSAAEDYLTILKLGGSRYPIDVLKAGGVDITDSKVLQAVMIRYGELQQQLEEELDL